MLDNTSFTLTSDPKITDQRMPKQNKEVLISDLRSRMTAAEPLNTALVGGKSKAETQDIVYSNIVSPERLQKTYELYKRFNGFSSSEVTIVAGEKFYECHDNITESVPKVIDSSHNSSETLIELKDLEKSSKVLGGVTKKNAFYTSKYLVVDSKGINIPKSLETRPSILSGQNPKDEGKNFLLGVNKKFSDEMIVKWLKDNSNNLGSI